MKMKLAGFIGLLPLMSYIFLLTASTTQGAVHYYDFVLQETNVTKLCVTREILTVNGQYPGPEIRIRKGDTVYVNTYNQGFYGVTLHWHGVKNPRNSWSDGPEYITQCAINPGQNFTYEVFFTDEEGTLWWHAHSDWTRATVHGAIIILPEEGTSFPFPFPEPDDNKVIVLGPWYNGDLKEQIDYALETAGDIPKVTGYTINGQLGHFNNCSTNETIDYWTVDYNKTYHVRIINAVLDDLMFFAIAGHNVTVVGMDGAYLKPFVTKNIMISPGNTLDVLVTTNQSTDYRYYMASRMYCTEDEPVIDFVGTAILQYRGLDNTSAIIFPTETLPKNLDFAAGTDFTNQLRSLANDDHPISVPTNVTTRMYITVSMDLLDCPSTVNCSTATTSGNGTTLASSLNNISWWVDPQVDILQAYYRNMSGVYTTDFPNWPKTWFNFTTEDYSLNSTTSQGTRVKVLDYNEIVEIVFQGTSDMGSSGIHPMHMHGYSFYVLGSGLGNFDNETDPSSYNLVDPPSVNTVGIPKLGWLAIRFQASNPGVWFWHCHLERHLSRGMDTVFIVKDGGTEETSLRPPPPNMPSCLNSTILTTGSGHGGLLKMMD